MIIIFAGVIFKPFGIAVYVMQFNDIANKITRYGRISFDFFFFKCTDKRLILEL